MPRTLFDLSAFVAAHPLFAATQSEALARIASSACEVDVPRGAFVTRRGEPCTGVHVVVYGQVKLSARASRGHEKVMDLIGPGQSFGKALMFLGKAYLADAQALARTKLVFLPRDALIAALDTDAGLAQRMLAALSARIHRLVCEVEANSLRSGRQRVIEHILDALPKDADAQPARAVFSTGKGVVASRLDLTQEHFSRILRELSASGLIEVRGREIVVPSPARLRADAVRKTAAGSS